MFEHLTGALITVLAVFHLMRLNKFYFFFLLIHFGISQTLSRAFDHQWNGNTRARARSMLKIALNYSFSISIEIVQIYRLTFTRKFIYFFFRPTLTFILIQFSFGLSICFFSVFCKSVRIKVEFTSIYIYE